MKALLAIASLLCAYCAAQSQAIEVLPRKELFTVTGRITDVTTGKPAAGKHAYVTLPGPVFEFRMATSDSTGKVTFLIKNVQNYRQLIFQTDNIADSNIKLELPDPLMRKFDAQPYPDRIREVGDTLPFFGKGDKEYLLDDYVRFPTMDEVFREFVAEVRVRKVRDGFRVEVLNLPYKLYFDKQPLVLLDGVPMFDMNALMALDPLKIRSIQVVSRRYYLGTIVLNGIISLNSYESDLGGYQLPKEAQVRELPTGH